MPVMNEPDRRWPKQVYGQGTEPDPRFSFANERTLLAWIRTALGLVASGVVAGTVDLQLADPVRRGLAVLLVVLGTAAAVAGWFRWARAERAMRQARPLPAPSLAAVVVLGMLVAGVVALVGLAVW